MVWLELAGGEKLGCGLYVHLLYPYLHAFVPNYGFEAHQPYRSSLLHYSSECDGSVMLQMEFVVYTLVHFCLVSISHGFEPAERTGSPRSRSGGSNDFVKSKSGVSQIANGCSVTPWNSLIQRPLYKFILRTF
ncbi:hypothetical protein IFM89_024028 [Coptis chinensis]|uniref:Uncharacterized protein n=1 Tax=Coptis chinensis TaxID=261450 RepID=A0A835LCI4_9MAGN|nr:hypothetical protein IFM89_024028 [Coptis chinensis]